ncbi:MAG: hypothetical protein PHD95_01615 [Candidatus ainarchaeum sp.]|nr:hypothetical protein [Candidatus ainarchaeum sp.]
MFSKNKCKAGIMLLAFLFFAASVMAACGNGSCETGEDYSNCPSDCQNPNYDLVIDSPAASSSFLRGDTIVITAHIFDRQKNVLLTDYFTARGFFGSLQLYDDGDHNDGRWKDGIFGNYSRIHTDQNRGIALISIAAGIGKTYLLKKISIEIKPELTTSLKTDKEIYYLGDEVIFTGTVARHNVPLEKEFDLAVSDPKNKEYKIPVKTNAEGIFIAKLHTSMIDSAGTWNAKFYFLDDLNNTAKSESGFQVKNPEAKSLLSIQMVEPPSLFYRRGNDLLLLIKISDDLGNEISDANIELISPLGTKTPFEKSDSNQFFVAIKVPVSMPMGKQSFLINAKAISENVWKSGDLNIQLNIKDIGIKTELLSPMSNQIQVGETANFSVRMYYENGEPLYTKVVPAKINGKDIVLEYKETGVYSGKYYIEPGDSKVDFAIDFTDEFGNKGAFSAELSVEGTSIQYYLKEYFYIILAIIAIGAILLWFLRMRIKYNLEVSRLRKKIALYEELMEKADRDFVEGIITRDEFNRITTKYTAELAVAKSKIVELEARGHGKKQQ